MPLLPLRHAPRARTGASFQPDFGGTILRVIKGLAAVAEDCGVARLAARDGDRLLGAARDGGDRLLGAARDGERLLGDRLVR